MLFVFSFEFVLCGCVDYELDGFGDVGCCYLFVKVVLLVDFVGWCCFDACFV